MKNEELFGHGVMSREKAIKLLKEIDLGCPQSHPESQIVEAIELLESAQAGKSDDYAQFGPITSREEIIEYLKQAETIDKRIRERIIDLLESASRRYGKCPNNHITVYGINDKPHCMVADCAGPVHEIVMEIEYAQLQAENKKLMKQLLEHGEALQVLSRLRQLYNLSSNMRDPQVESSAKLMMRQAEEGLRLAHQRTQEEYIKQLQAELERQKKINENQRVIINNQREKLKQVVNPPPADK